MSIRTGRKTRTGRKYRRHRRSRRILIIPVIVAVLCVLAALAVHFSSVEIRMNGDEETVVEYGTSYREPGAEAHFSNKFIPLMDKDLEVSINSDVDESTLGEYEVEYSAAARPLFLPFPEIRESVRRKVVVKDTEAPEITLVTNEDSYTLPGREYVEEGYSAADNYDGDLTDAVKRVEKNGKVIYTVTDSSGNKTRKVRKIVYDDRTPPELEIGEPEVTIAFGGTWKDSYKAVDDVDGDITDRVKVIGKVDKFNKGKYTLTYEATDSYGNTTTAKRVVRVKAPLQNPKSPTDKVIYLTFDDGPGQYTKQLLDILAKYNVKATFFVTNQFPKYQDLIAKEAAAGHVVAVHTYSHRFEEVYSSPKAYWADFDKMNDIIEAQTGSRSTMFRFPGGSSNRVSMEYCTGVVTAVAEQAADKGYSYYDWNVDSADSSWAKTPEQVADNLIETCSKRNSSLVLCHDIKSHTVEAMDQFITWALENGYSFAVLKPESYGAHHRIKN